MGRVAICKPRAAPNPRWACESLAAAQLTVTATEFPVTFIAGVRSQGGRHWQQGWARSTPFAAAVCQPARRCTPCPWEVLSACHVECVGHSGTPETLGAPRGSHPAETLTLTV